MKASSIFKKTKTNLYPRIEGNNICTWIGFKHVMYVVEEAVVDHMRQNKMKLRDLYEENGLCFEIVDSEARILHALHLDDEVQAEVFVDDEKPHDKDEVYLLCNLFVVRESSLTKAVVCRLVVQFKIDDSPVTKDCPIEKNLSLKQWTTKKISRSLIADSEKNSLLTSRGEINPNDSITDRLKSNNSKAMVWKWHIPYFYCHFNERMKHSGYLRLLEEAEDLFLADNNISIRTMLHEKKLIPVVPTARVQILEEAYMEEVIYTVYSLIEVTRDFTYTHQMDCYVSRNNKLIHVAIGNITHGYAKIDSRKEWSLIAFDEETKKSIHQNLVK